MLDLTPEQRTALAQSNVSRRLFLWVDALGLDGVTPDPAGFWTDVGDVEVDGRVYHGSGGVIGFGALSFVGDMTIRGLSITLSGIDIDVEALVRGSTIAQRPVELKTGLFHAETRTLVGPLIPRFRGRIDDAEIVTPEAGGQSRIVLTCESASRVLALRRYDTRANGSAHERDPDDDLYRHTAVQREKPLYWGREAPR